MQPFPNPDAAATPTTIHPTVTVSMLDDHLVICAAADLDLEMTDAQVIAAASALAAGSTVMIDLDPETASDELIARRPLSAVTATCITGDGGPVGVLGAGYVGFTTSDAYWTIDLTQGRLCRSDDAIRTAGDHEVVRSAIGEIIHGSGESLIAVVADDPVFSQVLVAHLDELDRVLIENRGEFGSVHVGDDPNAHSGEIDAETAVVRRRDDAGVDVARRAHNNLGRSRERA